jgi:hypothetical protein
MAPYSSRCHPVPTPKSSRPPDTTSSVAAIFASRTAGRSGVISTPVASRMRAVAPAIAASIVSGSNQGYSGGSGNLPIGAGAHHDVVGEVDLVDTGGLRLARHFDHPTRVPPEQSLEAKDSQ